MSQTEILEVSSLAERHPELVLVEECGTKLIIRLSVDPVDLGTSCRQRSIRIEHRPRVNPEAVCDLVRTIAWKSRGQDAVDRHRKHRNTVGDDTLTEWAAIGMMGLLVHHLEGGTIRQVIRKGTGGDYLVKFDGAEEHVEVSGIREDRTPTGSTTSSRVTAKTDQLLAYADAGLVSVTAFAYGVNSEVRSVLHSVRRPPVLRSRRKKKGRR